MELNEIVGLSTSFVLTSVITIFNESIKEIIRKYFSLRTKKEIKKYYFVLLITAIVLPIMLMYFTSDKMNKSKIETVGHSTPIQPIQKPKN